MRQWQQLQWKWGKAQIGHELRRAEVRNEIPTSLCEAPLLVHSTNCCLLRFYVLQRGCRFFPLTSTGVSNESFDKTNTDELRGISSSSDGMRSTWFFAYLFIERLLCVRGNCVNKSTTRRMVGVMNEYKTRTPVGCKSIGRRYLPTGEIRKEIKY